MLEARGGLNRLTLHTSMSHSVSTRFIFSIIAALLLVAIALPAFAHADARMTRTTNTEKKSSRTVDASCMQEAVGDREEALLAAFSDFHDELEEALSARKEALNTAWGMSNMKDRRKAIGDAMKAWKSDHKTAFKGLRDERKSAWDAFKTAAKSCGETIPVEESLGKDASGELAL